jgi:trk system potassium uptake protein TrkH
LFTATSAISVTGLVVVDTYNHWTLFGQLVILSLIQIGALGFMFVATVLSLLIGRKIALKERLLLAESFNIDSTQGIVRLTKRILFGTVLFQTIGAIILSFRFIEDYGVVGGIYRGIFHAISAFCNAGFDLMGDNGAFSGLTVYRSDTIMNLTIMVLIILGSLGFTVWNELFFTRRTKKLSLHTKVVVATTSILLFGGTLLFWVFEMNNAKTLALLSPQEQLVSSTFASTSHRTAGFSTLSTADLTHATLLITMILMFIGGAPDSTSGGIKTTTIVVLLTSVVSTIRHREDIEIASHRISFKLVAKALTILTVSLAIVFMGTLLLILSEKELPLTALMFEAVSAFGTVGLSMGITPLLNDTSKAILILLMFLGKIGVLSLGYAVALNSIPRKPLYRLPQAKLLV